ncbi:MAG: hypothetical protein EOP70_04725 [Variovorax sp.]|nr:MAG: hypothetical protein EOP70_04725 [Variovorax sp.]
MHTGDRFRRRRFCKYVVRVSREDAGPAGMTFEELDDFGFYQSTAINTYAGGIRRDFAPVEPAIRRNEAVREIVGTCLRALMRCTEAEAEDGDERGDGVATWNVYLHQMRIDCSTSMVGQPTPEGLHRDGHDFISMHLMDRAGIEGGTSTLCDTDGRTLMTLTLRDRMDGFLLNDRALLHGVSPITPTTDAAGHRDMLIVDYNRDHRDHENRHHRPAA